MPVSHVEITCDAEVDPPCETRRDIAVTYTPFAVARAIGAGWIIQTKGRNRLVGAPSYCPQHRDKAPTTEEREKKDG